ncbi:hypothetical protein BDP27DRAFT_1328851, partial [Rhodocollybia butyracea]
MAFEICSQCHSSVFKSRVNVTNDVDEHLRSTNSLPENILSSTSRLLLSIDEDLDGYESEIHRLQIRIADIRNRQERLKTYATHLHSLFSPIRRLPNELLTSIFGYVCVTNRLDVCEYGAALTLSYVCLRWRQLTIGCPELWSKMTIDICNVDDDEVATGGKLATFVNIYLDRSKSLPLQLTFVGVPWHPDSDDSDIPLFTTIARQSFRWKQVTIYAVEISPEIYTWDSLNLPILDTLNLHPLGKTADCSLEMFKETPMLRVFHSRGMGCQWDQDLDFPLPSAKTALHDLEYDPRSGHFYEILDNCPNLHRLSVASWITKTQNTTTVASKPPRILSKLDTLSVALRNQLHLEGNSEDNFLTSILSSFTAPHLKNLVLRQINEWQEPPPFSAIHSFLTRSSCSLKVLSLKQIALSDLELVDPPGSKPSISKAFIESLHSWKRSSIQTSLHPIAKSLLYLSLTAKSTEFDAAVFIDMISSRWIPDPDMAKSLGISCLRSVELFLPQETAVARDAYQPLLPFEKAGMMIVVKYDDR